MYEALADVATFMDVEALASDFGIKPPDKTSNFPLDIFLDVAMLGFGFVMGPMWSKGTPVNRGGGGCLLSV